MIHGSADAVIDAKYSLAAARQLNALGAKVTVDIVPGMSHGIDARMLSLGVSKISGQ